MVSILGGDRLDILGRRSDMLDAYSRGPDKVERGELDTASDDRSEQPASNIEIDISSMEYSSEVSNDGRYMSEASSGGSNRRNHINTANVTRSVQRNI